VRSGKLCERNWWKTPTIADVQDELTAGAGVMARNKGGLTPLHMAAADGTPANLKVLLDAGADGKAKDKDGKTPRDDAQ
jgi:ankyrin repeat protein